jgi:hypothetical protein
MFGIPLIPLFMGFTMPLMFGVALGLTLIALNTFTLLYDVNRSGPKCS